MKRIVFIMLSLMLVLSLCACGNGDGSLNAKDVNRELLCRTWRMDLYLGEDAEGETYFIKYELDATLSEVTKDMYSMEIKTVNAAYADGTTSNMIIHTMPDEFVMSGDEPIPDINGTTVGLVEDGIMTFQISGLDDAMFHMEFVRADGVVYGVALEHGVNTGYYYSIEMYVI